MKVLLTGGSGFLASHCISSLLQRGHSVIFTVRSDEKGQKVLASHPDTPSGQLSFVVVKDIAEETAFNEALQSVPPFDAVIHTASPFHLNIDDPKQLLTPAIFGTIGILKAVKRLAPSVKRVVITSSFAAMLSPIKHPDKYNETRWNPITQEESIQNPANAYRASKTFAEKAAWEFMGNEHPQFDLVTINPPLVLGPVVPYLNSLDEINTSNARIRNMIQGQWKDKLPSSLGVYLWADVRDVALAHVEAIEVPEAGGKRFLIAADTYMSNADIAAVVMTEYPQLAKQLPETLESDLPKDVYGFDNSASKQILKLEYRRLDQTVVDTIESLLAVGA